MAEGGLVGFLIEVFSGCVLGGAFRVVLEAVDEGDGDDGLGDSAMSVLLARGETRDGST